MYDRDPSEVGPQLIGELQGSLDDHVLGLTNHLHGRMRMNVAWGTGYVRLDFLEANEPKSYAILEELFSNTTIEVAVYEPFDRELIREYISAHQVGALREDHTINGVRHTIIHRNG